MEGQAKGFTVSIALVAILAVACGSSTDRAHQEKYIADSLAQMEAAELVNECWMQIDSPSEIPPLLEDMKDAQERFSTIEPPDSAKELHALQKESMAIQRQLCEAVSKALLSTKKFERAAPSKTVNSVAATYRTRLSEIEGKRVTALEQLGFSREDYADIAKWVIVASPGEPRHWSNSRDKARADMPVERD